MKGPENQGWFPGPFIGMHSSLQSVFTLKASSDGKPTKTCDCCTAAFTLALSSIGNAAMVLRII
jgi:hypothetical protein